MQQSCQKAQLRPSSPKTVFYRNILSLLCLTISLTFLFQGVYGQQRTSLRGKAASKLIEGADKVVLGTRNLPTFIRFGLGKVPMTKNVHDLLQLSEGYELVQTSEFDDKLGFTHRKYQQVYEGFPEEVQKVSILDIKQKNLELNYQMAGNSVKSLLGI